jgi:hypothetical protein
MPTTFTMRKTLPSSSADASVTLSVGKDGMLSVTCNNCTIDEGAKLFLERVYQMNAPFLRSFLAELV